MTNVSSQRGGHLDGHSKQQAFPHRTIGGTASPLPSPMEPTPGQREVFSPPAPSHSPLFIYLQNLPRVNTTNNQAARLHDSVCDASNSTKSAIFERLYRYLRDVFPPDSPHHRPAAATHQQQQTRRQTRRREYATQCHYAGSRSNWHSTSADQIPQEHLRQQYHNTVGHRLVIIAYQSDARSQARGLSPL